GIAIDVGDPAAIHQPGPVRRNNHRAVLRTAKAFDLQRDAPLPGPDQCVELSAASAMRDADVEHGHAGLSRAPPDPLGEPLFGGRQLRFAVDQQQHSDLPRSTCPNWSGRSCSPTSPSVWHGAHATVSGSRTIRYKNTWQDSGVVFVRRGSRPGGPAPRATWFGQTNGTSPTHGKGAGGSELRFVLPDNHFG